MGHRVLLKLFSQVLSDPRFPIRATIEQAAEDSAVSQHGGQASNRRAEDTVEGMVVVA